MNQHIHWHCVEARDPFLRAFRAEAAARYLRVQAQRERAEYEKAAGHKSRVVDPVGARGRS